MPLLLAFVSLASSAGAETAGVLSGQQLEALLQESSKALESLLAARNQSVPSELAAKRDGRGKTLKDDLQQNVMSPEVQSRLEAWKASAAGDLRANDLPGAQVTLTRLRADLAAEIERFKAIIDYWKEVGQKPQFDRTVAEDTLRANGVEAPHLKEAAALRAEFDQQIAAGEFAPAMRVTWPRFQEANTLARAEESQLILSRLDAGELGNLPSALPTRKCVPAKGTSHTDLPAVRVDGFPSINKYYTEKMASAGMGGHSEVFVVVDSQGCPERAIVIGTAGHPDLDTAALRMAVDGYYLPAEKDGAAARGAFSFRIDLESPYAKRR